LRAADLILHTGDFVSASFLDELRTIGPPVEAVYGNGDEPSLKASLERTRVLDVEGARIGVVHVPGPRAASVFCADSRAARPPCSATRTSPRSTGTRASGCSIPARRRAPTKTMIVLRVDAGSLAPKLVDFGP
jgi:calcineurin-like phosphoesterase family protein